MKRILMVTRAPGSDDRPQIKISNRFLTRSGFVIGGKVLIIYGKEKLIITKK